MACKLHYFKIVFAKYFTTTLDFEDNISILHFFFFFN